MNSAAALLFLSPHSFPPTMMPVNACRVETLTEVRMETIDDIRRQYGNPNAGYPDGPVQPINRSFRLPDASLRLASLIIFILGVMVTVAGVWTLVLPISAVGLGILAAAIITFARAMYISHHTRDFERDV
jgi:hypothetical protein